MYYGEITHNDIKKLLDLKNFFLNKSPHKNKFSWEEILDKKDFISVLRYVVNEEYRSLETLIVNNNHYSNDKHYVIVLNACNFEIPIIYTGASKRLMDISKSGTNNVTVISCLLIPFIMSENECKYLTMLSAPKTSEYWDYPNEIYFYLSKGCTEKDAIRYAANTKTIPDEFIPSLRTFNLVMFLRNIYKYKENLIDYKEIVLNDHR